MKDGPPLAAGCTTASDPPVVSAPLTDGDRQAA